MSDNTLVARTNSQTIDQTWFNDLRTALIESILGRNSSGVPTSGKDLGSSLYPFGSVYAGQLVIDGALVDLNAVLTNASHKVISGKTHADSNQSCFLTPAGSGNGRSLTIAASVTPLAYEVAGESNTLETNIVVSGLTAAPSSNNTALLGNGDNTVIRSSKLGEKLGHDDNEDYSIVIGSVGSNITALVGKRAAFKYSTGGRTEYFTAYVESTTSLSNAYRGFFFSSTLAPIKRTNFNTGDGITLLKMGWLFLDIDGSTTEAIYNEPIYSATQPGSPGTADYWYDLTNRVWKRYSGSVYAEVDRLLIGVFCSDSSDTLGCRPVDFYGAYKPDNTIGIELKSVTQVIGTHAFQGISVFGNYHNFGITRPVWDITTDLAASSLMIDATEQVSRYYFCYVKDTGALVMSDIAPYWRGDLQGWYHNFAPWRCVGYAYNNTSGNLESPKAMPLLEYGWASKNNFILGGVPRKRLEPLNATQANANGVAPTASTSPQSLGSISHTPATTKVHIRFWPAGGTNQYFSVVSGIALVELTINGVSAAIWTFGVTGGNTVYFPPNFIYTDSATIGTAKTYAFNVRSDSGAATVQALTSACIIEAQDVG